MHVKRAFCSECSSYVILDDSGACPGGHPRPCYRDVRDVDHEGAARANAPISSVLPLPVPTVKVRRWPWILAAALAVVLMSSACLAGVSAVSLVVGSAAKRSSRPYPPLIPEETRYVAPTADQQMWALATSGILTEANGERHDMLGGCERTPENIRVGNQGLSEWWGINSRADLLEALSWIENGGHRRGFDQTVSQLASATPEQLADMRIRVAGNAAATNELEVALKYGKRFGPRSISGWDYSRYVFLCRRGYLGGYLTEDEAWRKIMPVAKLLQANFRSWEDLGDNYIGGREYWSLTQTQKDGELFNASRQRLLHDPESPWLRIPWNLNLG